MQEGFLPTGHTKYIKPELANEQTHQALFHLEGEVTGALEHPSIVPVYGLNKDSRDRLYYAMRYIPGRKLTRVIQEYHRISYSEKESKREAFMSLLQNFHACCLAIEYAHIKGVLHCDIKPDNIMVGDFGEVFVVDWGLTVVQNKNTETQSPDPQMTTEEGQIPTFRPSESAARGLHINQGGSRHSVGGTPAYMAPEQLQASKLKDIALIGPPSDIYGLGATLYHITTGKAPHLPIKQPRETLDDFDGRIMAGKFPTPIEMNNTIPIYLNAIVMRAMALNPQDRYTSARDLAEDVKWFMANNPVTAYETPLHEKQKSEAVTNELMFKYEAQEISLPNPTLIDKNLKRLQEISSIRNNKEVQEILSIRDNPKEYNPKDLPRTMYSLMNSDLPMDRPVDYKYKKASHKASNFLYYVSILITFFVFVFLLLVSSTTRNGPTPGTAYPTEPIKAIKIEPAIDTTSTYTDPGSKVADGAESGGSSWTLTGAGFIGITVAILFLGVCFKLWKNHLKAKLVDQGKDESVVVPDVDDLSPKSISPKSISPESISLKSIFEPVKVNNSKLPDTKIIIEMALVPAGKFKMGSPASEKGRSDGETQHEVTLTKPFYMGKYEVTQEQWESVMGKNPSRQKGAKLPVTNVSWEDCQAFIKKLNDKTKGGYRLPTEAEWEFACRAGTSTAYSFGTKIRLKDSNCADLKIGKPLPVGSFKPNTYGLYDMHGNVWEWCEDWFGDYSTGTVTDPIGPVVGQVRVLRGGSFNFNASYARSSSRNYFTPSYRNFNNGFRLARTP